MPRRQDDYLYLHVWIHGHEITGRPVSVDVFDVDGRFNMFWFQEVFIDGNGPDLADQFYSHLKKVDDSAWFKCLPMHEDASGSVERYVDVIEIYSRQIWILTNYRNR